MNTIKYIKHAACVVSFLFATGNAFAVGFTLPATTTGPGKIDLGLYSGGSVLTVSASGQISLISGWNTFADGSLVHPINPVGPLVNYGYANAGASGYSTIAGGDGINHFSGGGANYDINAGSFGLAGAMTTDTTSPNAIRFGAVVGTFKPSPTRADWFFIGTSSTVVVPGGGAHLYVAVHDTTYPNNSGAYAGNYTVIVPEPSVIALGGMAFLTFLVRRNSARR